MSTRQSLPISVHIADDVAKTRALRPHGTSARLLPLAIAIAITLALALMLPR